MDIPKLYTDIILAIGDGTGAPDSLLHVHAGMAILFLARIVTGRALSTPLPFLIVCVAEAGNEILDRLQYGSWRWPDTSMDIVHTLFWPFVLMVGLRLRKARSRGETRPEPASTPAVPTASIENP